MFTTIHRRMFFLLLLFTLLFSSCSRKMGWGVLIWSENEETYKTGEVLAIYEKSTIRESFLAGVDGTKERSEFPLWRLRFFEEESEALEYQKELGDYMNMFAISSRTGLPIRQQPSTSGHRVYKLADGQTIKILGRQDEEVEIGHFKGFWYHVLTEDGTEGWCFDYYLDVFKMENGEQVFLQKERESDKTKERIFDVVWRPDFYQKALAFGRVDLGLFRADYHLRFDGENKKIIYKSAGRRFEREFEDVVKIKADTYEFVGASFRVIVYGSDFLSIQFSEDNQEIGEAWVVLDKSLPEIIDGELDRRGRVLERLVSNGPEYTSNGFGTLSFEAGGQFKWTGKSKLISRRVLTNASGNNGKVYFDHFLGEEIMRNYDGVMRLKFQGGDEVFFLYLFNNNTFDLTLVNSREITRSIVQTDFHIKPLKMTFVPKEAEPESPEAAEEPQS